MVFTATLVIDGWILMLKPPALPKGHPSATALYRSGSRRRRQRAAALGIAGVRRGPGTQQALHHGSAAAEGCGHQRRHVPGTALFPDELIS